MSIPTINPCGASAEIQADLLESKLQDLNETSVEARTASVKAEVLSDKPIGLPKPLSEKAIILITNNGEILAILDGEDAEMAQIALFINYFVGLLLDYVDLKPISNLRSNVEIPSSDQAEKLATEDASELTTSG